MNGLGRLIGALAALGLVGIAGYGVVEYRQLSNKDRVHLEELSAMQAQIGEKEAALAEQAEAIATQKATIDQQGKKLEQNELLIQQQDEEIDQLAADVTFLSVSTRIATIKALRREQVEVVDEAGPRSTDRWLLRFQEYDPHGNPIGLEREGFITGSQLKVEHLTVEWDYSHPDFKGQDEFLRRPTLVLIRRLYGTDEAPNATSFVIDDAGKLPEIYAYARGGQNLTPFEQHIVDNFWEIANDPEQQDEQGIRFIGSSTPGIQLIEGRTYRLEVRESGSPKLKAVGGPKELDPAEAT